MKTRRRPVPIDTQVLVFERDRWLCRVCRRPVVFHLALKYLQVEVRSGLPDRTGDTAVVATDDRNAIRPAVVRNQRPHDQTNRPKRSPAPLFHCATKAMRQEMWDAYAWFVGAYRQAAEKLKAGDRTADFPPGCFPPAMPFVPA